MIRRSVPGYAATLSMISTITAEFACENSRLYDLGCSLGTATLAMRHGIAVKGCEIIAVDNSSAMIKRCQKVMQRDQSSVPVRVIEQDLLHSKIRNASVVVMNYTLQFIPLELRAELLTRIYQGLLPGGVLVLSEKIVFSDPDTNRYMSKLYTRFKLQNGYDELEIARKRTALEHILIPETRSGHIKRLKDAGFATVTQCMQFLNFITLLARKNG